MQHRHIFALLKILFRLNKELIKILDLIKIQSQIMNINQITEKVAAENVPARVTEFVHMKKFQKKFATNRIFFNF